MGCRLAALPVKARLALALAVASVLVSACGAPEAAQSFARVEKVRANVRGIT